MAGVRSKVWRSADSITIIFESVHQLLTAHFRNSTTVSILYTSKIILSFNQGISYSNLSRLYRPLLGVYKGTTVAYIYHRISKIIGFKGTVHIILSECLCKDSNARFTKVPLAPQLIKNYKNNVIFFDLDSNYFVNFSIFSYMQEIFK